MRLKKLWILLAVMVLFLFPAGCSTHGSFSGASADPQKIADQIRSSVKFTDQFSEMSSDAAVKRYGIGAGEIVSCAVYVGTGATAEEISVWKAKDKNAAQTILKKAQEFIEKQKESYADYQPAEVPKLNSAVLRSKDTVVVACVSADNESAKRVIAGLLK